MDTFKDKQILDELEASDSAPWWSGTTGKARPRAELVSAHMIQLSLRQEPSEPFNVLCLGAHSDDIEIGCGGTLLRCRALLPETAVLLGGFQRDSGSAASEATMRGEFVRRRSYSRSCY